MFKFAKQGVDVIPQRAYKMALPRVKSFIERRVMTRFPGQPDKWIERLDTDDGAASLANALGSDKTPIDVNIIPVITRNLPDEKWISTLTILTYIDMAEHTNAVYG